MKFSFILLLSCFGFLALSSAQVYEYTTNKELTIAYRTFGSGKPLVVINGGPGRSSESFLELAKKLSSNRRQVILFDQRGTGKSHLSVISEETIQFPKMIEDLERLRKHLGHEKISILGHSFGGMYAMAYANKYPDRVERMILSASGGPNLKNLNRVESSVQAKLDKDSLKKYKFWTSAEQKKKDPIKSKLEALRLTAPAYVFNKKFVPLIEKNLTNLVQYSPEINLLVWKSLKNENYDLSGKFTKFHSPVLVIDGEQDFLGKEIPAELHQNFPNSRLEILKECSHYPWLDKPAEYFTLINEFLD